MKRMVKQLHKARQLHIRLDIAHLSLGDKDVRELLLGFLVHLALEHEQYYSDYLLFVDVNVCLNTNDVLLILSLPNATLPQYIDSLQHYLGGWQFLTPAQYQVETVRTHDLHTHLGVQRLLLTYSVAA